VAISPGGDSHRERYLIQIWLRGAVGGGLGPALSEFDATGVPAPVASSVESCSHLANHQASASHDASGQQRIPHSLHQCPRDGTRHSTILVVAGAPLRKGFQQFDLAGAYQGFPRCTFAIYRHT